MVVTMIAALANLMRASRLYLSAMLVGNFIWETLQLPLYTIWRTGTLGQQVFAVVVCTVEDLLIALGTLALALIIVGSRDWPAVRFKTVAVLVIAIGLAYTVFSEWLNVVVRSTWAYSELMPGVPFDGLEIGLSPLLQWIIVPALCLEFTRRWMSPRRTILQGGNGI
jgi:hypothetical protein